MRFRYVVGGLVVILFLVWGATAFLETTIQYVSVEEAARSEHTVQVMGKIDFDRVVYNSEEVRLDFAVYDPEAVDEAAAKRMPVLYYGVVPGNFDQSTSVVLKGKGVNGVFFCGPCTGEMPFQIQGGRS